MFSSPLGSFSTVLSRMHLPDSQTANTYVNPDEAFRGDQGASELLGRLNRAQWTDWRERFAPYIDQLANVAQDDGAPAAAGRQASNAMGLAFDASTQAQQQDREGFGISQTDGQRQAEERRTGLMRAGSTVSAGNQARISALDRQQAILAGGMGLSNIPDRVMQQ